MTRSDSSRASVVRVLLGLLLLCAAILKGKELGSGHIALLPFLSNPRWQLGIIEVAAALGLVLLLGHHRRGVWTLALAAFTLLGVASLYMALTGQESCNCFGAVKANPWLTFALDTVAVVALALTFPPRSAGVYETGPLRGKWRVGVGAVLLALFASPFLLASGDLIDALAWVRGEPVTIEPAFSDIGEGKSGEGRTFRVQVSNHTRRTLRIVGGTSRCDCVTTEELPLILQPGESRSIMVWVRFHGSPGWFQSLFSLFVDDEGKESMVIARYAGRVIPAAE